jgi:hypothetical protein
VKRYLVAIALLGCGQNLTPSGLTPFAPGEEAPLACTPNVDGVLEAGEIPVFFDAAARYLVNPAGEPRSFDREGTVDEAGVRSWDLATDYADDRVIELGALPIGDQWFATEFPLADFASPLSDDLLGVYHIDERGLWLHGVASSTPDPPEGTTLLPYDEPVPIVRLPLEGSDRWIATGEVSEGEALGLAYRGTDTYDVRVTGAGRLDLPDLSFGQAWQIDQRVTIEPAIGAPVERRIVLWMNECFGEVARAEGDAELDEAATLRRSTLR